MSTKASLWIDHNQGTTRDGRAFGYIGCDTDEEYCGWFFQWPRAAARIESVGERDAMLDSLDADSEHEDDPEIPLRLARACLATYLRDKFDLRRT